VLKDGYLADGSDDGDGQERGLEGSVERSGRHFLVALHTGL